MSKRHRQQEQETAEFVWSGERRSIGDRLRGIVPLAVALSAGALLGLILGAWGLRAALAEQEDRHKKLEAYFARENARLNREVLDMRRGRQAGSSRPAPAASPAPAKAAAPVSVEPDWREMSHATPYVPTGGRAVVYMGPNGRDTSLICGDDRTHDAVAAALAARNVELITRMKLSGDAVFIADGEAVDIVESGVFSRGVRRLTGKPHSNRTLWASTDSLVSPSVYKKLIARDKAGKSHAYDPATGNWKD